MNWAQVAFLVLMSVGLGIGIAEHGKPRSPHNLWVDLISFSLTIWLLYEGGFFS